MVTTDSAMQAHLTHVVNSLVNETRGAVDREEIRRIVDEAYEEIASGAKFDTFIPILTMRQAKLMLQSRAKAAAGHGEHPTVLLVCGTNAGRSQMAAALLRFYAAGHLEVVSAGQSPGDEVVGDAVAYLREHGVELTDYPKPLRPEYVDAADHVVFIGSNVADVPPGKDLEQWPVPHMTGLSVEEMHAAVGLIDERVRAFLARILPDVQIPPSIFDARP
jgi:ArsR family transcriptional regulator